MKHLLFYSVAFLFVGTNVLGQPADRDDFDRSFLEIYMHTASKDVPSALKAADSLYQSAQSDVHRLRSLMLISDMHHRLANRDSSIHYVRKAERIAEKTKNYIWLARIYGVLSTQYRETGLFLEGKRCLDKGLEVIENVQDSDFVNQFKGQSCQEMGFYLIEERKYQEAISQFKKADAFLRAVPDSVVRHFALAQSEERLGLCYFELEMVDSARAHYENALVLVRKASDADTPIKGFIYNGLGRVHLEGHNYGQADSCFQKALAIAEVSGFPNLEIAVYKSLAQYHQVTGNGEGYHHYNEQYLEALRLKTAKHRRYADNILANVRQKIAAMASSNQTLGFAAAGCVVLAGLGMGTYIHRQRKNHRRYKDVIAKLRNERAQALAAEEVIVETPVDRDKDLMPESTKQELLKKLERFESSGHFTDRRISIAILAGKLETNTKYLSYIIKNHRNKDFNTYINELRINYIIEKLETDNRYLHYKISYLAEECGFATHSQFTTVFRNITGLSPSRFMTYLKKDSEVGHPELLDA